MHTDISLIVIMFVFLSILFELDSVMCNLGITGVQMHEMKALNTSGG